MTEIQNPTEEPVVEPTAEPATEPVAAEETAAVAETATEPVAEEAAEPVAEDAAEEPQAETSTTSFATYETEAEVVNRLREISESDEEVTRQELDSLKSNFYRIHRQEADAAYKKFIEEGGAAEEYAPEPDPEETAFKELMAAIREKRAAIAAALELEREANYQKKLEIIDKIKALTDNPDEINRAYNDFKELQQQWNDIKEVPAEHATTLWKTYQQAVEAFYDTLKLSNELRAYDFKKNLERKTALCEAAEKLAEETDIIVAFRKLQQLHQDFRETGPVASELREEIWTRFKDASTVINKRHQEYFEARKQKEEENLEKKTAICETIEGFDIEGLKTFAEWNAISEKITALQAEWKTIGYAPQKMNTKIFERFRAACDHFFTRKNEYFQSVRENLNQNYALKLELVEQAEALKDSTDWKATTDALVELQKKWKEIGTVPKKYSDQIWERFNAACDAFFAANARHRTSGTRLVMCPSRRKTSSTNSSANRWTVFMAMPTNMPPSVASTASRRASREATEVMYVHAFSVSLTSSTTRSRPTRTTSASSPSAANPSRATASLKSSTARWRSSRQTRKKSEPN